MFGNSALFRSDHEIVKSQKHSRKNSENAQQTNEHSFSQSDSYICPYRKAHEQQCQKSHERCDGASCNSTERKHERVFHCLNFVFCYKPLLPVSVKQHYGIVNAQNKLNKRHNRESGA